MAIKGLLTLKDLSTEKIVDIIEHSLNIKKGSRASYAGKKFVTLFFLVFKRVNRYMILLRLLKRLVLMEL